MKLTGRWFSQIVDIDSGNLYPIYIKQKLWCYLLNLLAGDLGRLSCLVLYILDIDSHCKKFVHPHIFDMSEIKNQNKGIEHYIEYRFQLSLSTIWRNHLPFSHNQ